MVTIIIKISINQLTIFGPLGSVEAFRVKQEALEKTLTCIKHEIFFVLMKN